MKSAVIRAAISRFAIGALWFTAVGSARAAYPLPAYDAFSTNYANGARLREIANFDAGNSVGSGSNLTNSWSAGLSYAGLVTSNGSGGVIANGIPNSGRDAGFQLSPSFSLSDSSPTLYASFLLQVQSSPATTNLIALFSGGTGGGATPILGVYLDPLNRLWLSKSSAIPGTNTGTSLAPSATHLLVCRYKFSSTAGDEIALWVNPATNTFGASEAAVPAAALVTTNGNDAPTVVSFIFAHRTAAGISASGTKLLDEVRVAETWAEVTPPVGGSEPPGPVTNSTPVITQALLTGSNLILRGTNGVTNGVYQVVSASQSALPLANWVSIATNLFDGNGNFDSTNPISAGEAQEFFRLMLGGQVPPPAAPPVITNQPVSAAAFVGGTASFTVGAGGTAPLRYQWFFNTNAPIANATNASLILNFVQTSNAGAYTVIVTNDHGSVTSSAATLTVTVAPTNAPDGFAAYNYSLSGGAGGQVFTATNAASLLNALGSTAPRIIQIEGSITNAGNISVGNNKTIIGIGTNATIVGDLNISHATNVIVQNVHFTNPAGVGDGDGVTVEYSEHVWIDHCTFYDCSDGSLDITHGSDLVTVSWCKFYYTFNSGHNFVTLVGHSDNNASEDANRLRVTFHHNWWSTLCVERMPRVRFGKVHVFNNYANTPGNNYCVRASISSEVLVENNFYENLDSPYEYFAPNGLIKSTGNTTVNCTGVQSFNDPVFSPPYSYTLETPAAAKSNAMAGAGAGRGVFP